MSKYLYFVVYEYVKETVLPDGAIERNMGTGNYAISWAGKIRSMDDIRGIAKEIIGTGVATSVVITNYKLLSVTGDVQE